MVWLSDEAGVVFRTEDGLANVTVDDKEQLVASSESDVI